MIHEPSILSVLVFAGFVAITLGLSFYFARKTQSSAGYFAAGGQIHWFVNGVAFAGDYLSAASFLGICGMIASILIIVAIVFYAFIIVIAFAGSSSS